jgi:hypothetical protein
MQMLHGGFHFRADRHIILIWSGVFASHGINPYGLLESSPGGRDRREIEGGPEKTRMKQRPAGPRATRHQIVVLLLHFSEQLFRAAAHNYTGTFLKPLS